MEVAVNRVSAVCLGNICRSPIAAAVLRDRFARADLQVSVDSSGTGGWHVGEGADPRAQRTLAQAGYPHSHTARQFDPDDCGDLILAMDTHNYRDLQAILGADPRLRMIREFDPGLAEFEPGDPQLDVPDPYYGGADGFATVLAMLERAADGVVAHVQARGAAPS